MNSNMNFWRTANCAFSEAERQAFNKWRLDMYAASEMAVCAANYLPDEDRFSDVAQKARAAHEMVCAIPGMSL